MNVLVISCHPDDMEIKCAGTVIKCVKRGDNVTVCHVCNGNMGHIVIEPDELAKIRKEEAKKSGDLAGAKVITCDIGDLIANESSKEQRDLIVDIIREAQPDFIITHSPNDHLPDHVSVSRLVFDASFAACVPHYKTKISNISKITPIYYMDNDAGINFIPTHYVDITDEMNLKLQMLECHESQLKWMREHDGVEFTDYVLTSSRFRGYQCNTQYAEGFTECLANPKMLTKRLLP